MPESSYTLHMTLARLLLLALPIWLLSAWPCIAQSYEFTTIAGTPEVSGSSDGTNNSAQFRNPSGLALAPDGALIIADTRNHTVRRLTQSGANWIAQTIAGFAGATGTNDGIGAEARFNRPTGVAVDTNGTVFVVDRYNHTVRKVVLDGAGWIVTTIAGFPGEKGSDDGAGSVARFNLPGGIAIDPDGNLYIADIVNSTIRLLQTDGTDWFVTTIAGYPEYFGFVDGVGIDAEFFYPYAVAYDSTKSIVVADAGNHAIRRISGLGVDYKVTTIAGFSGLSGSIDGAAEDARFYFPNGVAVDPTGNIFVADESNDTVRKITSGSDGASVSTLGGLALHPGTNDGVGDLSRFHSPYGIAVSPTGTVFVADYASHTIRLGTPRTVIQAPALKVDLHTGQILISWPASAATYSLETADRPDAATWTKVSDGITTSGEYFLFTADADQAAAFYRLRSP